MELPTPESGSLRLLQMQAHPGFLIRGGYKDIVPTLVTSQATQPWSSVMRPQSTEESSRSMGWAWRRNIPEEVAARHPSVPWRLMSDMGNFAVHEYWGVELKTIWETIQKDLEPLAPLLEEVIKD